MLDPVSFRRACSRFATGITIATVSDANGVPHGFTANSFTSVSVEPPMILLCIDRRAQVLPKFQSNPHFAINILSEDQKELSMRFAARRDDRFQGVSWRPAENDGYPLLDGALAHFLCRTTNTLDAGDHVIFLGEVLAVQHGDGRPLLYYASAYRTLDPNGCD